MNPNVGELLQSGLTITVLGMGLVFAALALLWGLLRLLSAVFRDAPAPAPAPRLSTVLAEADSAEALAAIEASASLTDERARVAALVAGAMLANSLPLLFEAPAGPAFEHGRVAPSWVTSNRARALDSWQPPRIPEPNFNQGTEDYR